MARWLFYLLCIIPFFGWLGESYASPSITGLSGSIVDGSSVSIGGTSFGSHTLNIEWLGGASGHIESGTEGSDFSRANWTASSTSSSEQAPQYSTARAHSYSKSVMSSWPLESQYDSTWIYDTGIDGVEKIYATWWVYFDHVNSGGQWKMWYVKETADFNNNGTGIRSNIWYNADGSHSMRFFINHCQSDGGYDECGPDHTSGGAENIDAPPADTWVRVEVYGEESSAIGNWDGAAFYSVHNQTDAISDTVSWSGSCTRNTGVTSRWRRFIFANYWGNISGGDGTGEKVYIDDPYIQVGTRARVEIGDASTWANCTHREIQIPTGWSDTEITVTLNRGSFDPCETYYLFVVDADGNVNADGYPIKIVTGAGEPPCPPTGAKKK